MFQDGVFGMSTFQHFVRDCQDPEAQWILNQRAIVSSLRKIAVVVLLLVLVVGSLVQVYDTFNDFPAHDHDALLHTADALFCIILLLAVAGVWTFLIALLRLIESPPDISLSWNPRSTSEFVNLHALHVSPPPLRI